jgi:methylase of polypeptide subunit release factors
MTAAADRTTADQAQLIEFINAGWTTQAIATACEFDLPDRLAAGARAARELAAEAGVDEDALTRLLRALVTLGVCDEVDEQTFALGALGQLLRRQHIQGLRHWALLNGGPLWPRWGALSEKVRTGNGGSGASRSTERFRRLETDDSESVLFHGAMSELSRRVAASLAGMLAVPAGALVVDVGGGSGELLAGVLVQQPAARGLLFDLAPALDQAPPVLRRHGVETRCVLQPGSFFDEVPPSGDVYLLKSVLHDWDDEPAVRLLQRCAAALHPGAKLVVLERLLPERLSAAIEHRAVVRSDLNMLVALAGRERRLADYRALFERAGLVLLAVRPLAVGFSAMQVTAHCEPG